MLSVDCVTEEMPGFLGKSSSVNPESACTLSGFFD